jgi:hypothetical protein
MPIITCPDCGHHPVSDRAATCPKCGCPIAAVNASVAPTNQALGSINQAPTIREEREARLVDLGAHLRESNEFPDSSVIIYDSTNLAELVSYMQGWCEELELADDVRKRHIDMICRLSKLESLCITVGKLDDESLLRISKLLTLCKLKFHVNDGSATEAGWLQLAKLSRLEFLQLPVPLYRGQRDFASGEVMKQKLQRQLPRTIVK